MNIYYVYQGQKKEEEIKGGYLWSPIRNTDGGYNFGYTNMSNVKKGDIILHGAYQQTYAISIVEEDCDKEEQPDELKNVYKNPIWKNKGYMVKSNYIIFKTPLNMSNHFKWLAENKEYDSAFTYKGKGKATYLSKLAEKHFKYILKELILLDQYYESKLLIKSLLREESAEERDRRACRVKLAHNEHKKYVHQLFEECVLGQDSNNRKVYIKILEKPIMNKNMEESLNIDNYIDIVHITLITNKMLEYDKATFKILDKRRSETKKPRSSEEAELMKEYDEIIEAYDAIIEEYDEIIEECDGSIKSKEYIYRPYFFEFFVDLKKLDNNIKVKEIITKKEVVGNWIKASFINEDKEAEDKEIDNQEANDEESDRKVYHIPGNVLFSASPFREIGGRIEIKEKDIHSGHENINNQIKAAFDLSNAVKDIDVIRSILNQGINTEVSPKDYNVKIHNVGDANCCYISCSNNKEILFDIGTSKGSKDRNDSSIIKTNENIGEMEPNITILSHWDLDHVLGVVFAKQCIFNTPWIAPDINILPEGQKSFSSLRVAKHLELREKLYLVDPKHRNSLIYSNESLSLWNGKGKGKGSKLTQTNNAGLIIEIKVKNSNNNRDILTLLTGDCEYVALPDKMEFYKKRFDYLVVPHHCSQMETKSIKGSSIVGDYAIISVTDYPPKGSEIKRPYDKHVKFLENDRNYEIVRTGGKCYIEIPSASSKRIKIT